MVALEKKKKKVGVEEARLITVSSLLSATEELPRILQTTLHFDVMLLCCKRTITAYINIIHSSTFSFPNHIRPLTHCFQKSSLKRNI